MAVAASKRLPSQRFGQVISGAEEPVGERMDEWGDEDAVGRAVDPARGLAAGEQLLELVGRGLAVVRRALAEAQEPRPGRVLRGERVALGDLAQRGDAFRSGPRIGSAGASWSGLPCLLLRRCAFRHDAESACHERNDNAFSESVS